MKKIILAVLTIGCMGLLSGCCTNGCGYDDYQSQCGAYSCTDNSGFDEYNNPCPGNYQCNTDQ